MMSGKHGRQTSMSYPGQGRPKDADAPPVEEAHAPEKNPGRSTPSPEENRVRRNRRRR
jgi:hypothetical protein